jgi:hypothetical protein
MSLEKSIARLSATPPPPANMKFHNITRANARIVELESQVGAKHGKFIYNIGMANARISQLEEMAGLPKAAAPKPLNADSGILESPVGSAQAAQIAPVTLAALAREIYGGEAAETFEGQRTQFTRSGLEVPGLAPAKLSYTPQFSGLARTVRADRQGKVDLFFNSQP